MTDSTLPNACSHLERNCLNQYELIRKYRCVECDAVMMCACEEEQGKRFLSHQLRDGTDSKTQTKVRVTLGFQPNICSECRGAPADHAPMGETYGRSSKIKRYYWRELFFAETRRHADWEEAHPNASPTERSAAYLLIDAEILTQIKEQHATNPKYTFKEPSQAEILERYSIDVIALHALYVEAPQKGGVIRDGDEVISAEEFTARYFKAQGWSILVLESLPLHALFGVMMWLLIQDPNDPRNQLVSFANLDSVDAEVTPPAMVWTLLPDDFGSAAYAVRRAEAIEKHLKLIEQHKDDLLWLFDYWRDCSTDFRQYLWAYRPVDIDRARQLIEIMEPQKIFSILRYLIGHYWGRYLGWPDILLYRSKQILLIEVKSSKDKLSQDQGEWIAGNHEYMKLPFKLVKVHRRQ